MKIRDSGHSTKNQDCPAKFGTVGQSVATTQLRLALETEEERRAKKRNGFDLDLIWV